MSGDVRDDGWSGKSGTRTTRNELGPMHSGRPQGVSSHRGIHGKRPLGVWCRNGAMAQGGLNGWEVVSGSGRSGGMFHDEVAQGRGGEKLATPRNRGRRVMKNQEDTGGTADVDG